MNLVEHVEEENKLQVKIDFVLIKLFLQHFMWKWYLQGVNMWQRSF